tara:strand:+ start:401 stop:598 length:198 start_codon:yes stop_codon:yes gene_type:complete
MERKSNSSPFLQKKSTIFSGKKTSIAPKQRSEKSRNKYKPKSGSAAELITNQIVDLAWPLKAEGK